MELNSSFLKENGLRMEIVDLENGFFPNTDITGNIIIINNSINPKSIYLQLEIQKYVSHNNKTYLDEKTILDEHILEVNNLKTIDFTFPIPEDLTPSFEYPLNKYKCYIRYYLIGKCTSNDKVYSCSYIILIKAIYHEENIQNKYEVKTNISTYFNNKGECETIIYVDKNYITFDDQMSFNIEIHNEKCKLDLSYIKVTIQRDILFTSSDKKKLLNDQTINNRINHKINIKKEENGTEYLNINLNKNENFNFGKWINPYKNKSIFYLIPSIDSTHIKCIYSMKITLYLNEMLISKEHRPRIIIPILVGHQTKEEYDKIKKQKNKSVFNSDFLINQFVENNKTLEDYKKIERDDNVDNINYII
jgi:hypothetical protein